MSELAKGATSNTGRRMLPAIRNSALSTIHHKTEKFHLQKITTLVQKSAQLSIF